MRGLLLLVLVLLASGLPAQGQAGVTLRELIGARSSALAGAGVALQGATLPNPASAVGSPAALHLYADRAFGLSELQLVGAQGTLPTRVAAFRLDAASFGYEDFRAVQLALGAARGFRFGTSRTVQAGLVLAYHHLALGGDYGSAGALSVDAGLRTSLTPRLAGGMRATNLFRGRLAGAEPLPRRLVVGVAYAVDPRVTVVADVQQEVRAATGFAAGIEARIAGPLTVRAGAGSGPQRLALGFGVRAGRLVAEGAFSRHEALGWTPAVALGVGF